MINENSAVIQHDKMTLPDSFQQSENTKNFYINLESEGVQTTSMEYGRTKYSKYKNDYCKEI